MTTVQTPQSGTLSHWEHDEKSGTLTVHFRSGKKYAYFDVDLGAVGALRAAQSVGAFLAKTLRPNYRHAKVIG